MLVFLCIMAAIFMLSAVVDDNETSATCYGITVACAVALALFS